MTVNSLVSPTWADSLRILNPSVTQRLGHIRHALFDFDGTLSLIREGWAGVMIAFMLKSICGDVPPAPGVEQAVRDYVDQSTGTLTILQMKWLEQAVRQAGRVARPKTAREYKALYVQQLLDKVQSRKTALAQGLVAPDELMVGGSRALLAQLAELGVNLYLASGTDHAYVVDEARRLGLEVFFKEHMYGAQAVSEVDQKERIIRHILAENGLSGAELLVVGDGPVEIRAATKCGALALGVACDEVKRTGWDDRKVGRLTAAGADMLVPDFSCWDSLLDFLTHGVNHDRSPSRE
jgi:phosphoglycolate phosphatase